MRKIGNKKGIYIAISSVLIVILMIMGSSVSANVETAMYEEYNEEIDDGSTSSDSKYDRLMQELLAEPRESSDSELSDASSSSDSDDAISADDVEEDLSKPIADPYNDQTSDEELSADAAEDDLVKPIADPDSDPVLDEASEDDVAELVKEEPVKDDSELSDASSGCSACDALKEEHDFSDFSAEEENLRGGSIPLVSDKPKDSMLSAVDSELVGPYKPSDCEGGISVEYDIDGDGIKERFYIVPEEKEYGAMVSDLFRQISSQAAHQVQDDFAEYDFIDVINSLTDEQKMEIANSVSRATREKDNADDSSQMGMTSDDWFGLYTETDDEVLSDFYYDSYTATDDDLPDPMGESGAEDSNEENEDPDDSDLFVLNDRPLWHDDCENCVELFATVAGPLFIGTLQLIIGIAGACATLADFIADILEKPVAAFIDMASGVINNVNNWIDENTKYPVLVKIAITGLLLASAVIVGILMKNAIKAAVYDAFLNLPGVQQILSIGEFIDYLEQFKAAAVIVVVTTGPFLLLKIGDAISWAGENPDKVEAILTFMDGVGKFIQDVFSGLKNGFQTACDVVARVVGCAIDGDCCPYEGDEARIEGQLVNIETTIQESGINGGAPIRHSFNRIASICHEIHNRGGEAYTTEMIDAVNDIYRWAVETEDLAEYLHIETIDDENKQEILVQIQSAVDLIRQRLEVFCDDPVGPDEPDDNLNLNLDQSTRSSLSIQRLSFNSGFQSGYDTAISDYGINTDATSTMNYQSSTAPTNTNPTNTNPTNSNPTDSSPTNQNTADQTTNDEPMNEDSNDQTNQDQSDDPADNTDTTETNAVPPKPSISGPTEGDKGVNHRFVCDHQDGVEYYKWYYKGRWHAKTTDNRVFIKWNPIFAQYKNVKVKTSYYGTLFSWSEPSDVHQIYIS